MVDGTWFLYLLWKAHRWCSPASVPWYAYSSHPGTSGLSVVSNSCSRGEWETARGSHWCFCIWEFPCCRTNMEDKVLFSLLLGPHHIPSSLRCSWHFLCQDHLLPDTFQNPMHLSKSKSVASLIGSLLQLPQERNDSCSEHLGLSPDI